MPDLRLLAVVAVTAAVSASTANAATLYGSAAYLTARDCSALAATQDCVPVSPTQNPPRVYSSYLGGVGASLNTAINNPWGDWEVATGANPGGLPILKGGSWSADNSRTLTNAVVFQQFTYTGATPSILSLVGKLDFIFSGNDGLSDTGLSNTGAASEEAGEAGIFAAMYLMSPEAFSGVSTAEQVMALLGQGCGSAYVGAAAVYSAEGLSAGRHETTLKLNKGCDGREMVLSYGMSGVLVMALQAGSNRGGYSDATSTFVSALDPDLPTEDLLRLQNNFVPLSPQDVPEPPALALMLAGLVGLASSRRLRR